ncbi:unnamed protein product [Ectocarpus sp. CCAP 1310/34]|nr:unnamed protein product [Ectocarpus sp. CCAP 1310/34]
MAADGTTAAELFEKGRLSETLAAYSQEDGDQHSPQKAVYTACNRATAKLGLEMFRACIRDLDDAIKIDPYALRAYLLKDQAFRGLGKPDQAREALEAGIEAGKEGGDVVLYVQLVESLRQLNASLTPGGPTAQDAEVFTTPTRAPSATAPPANCGNVGAKDSSPPEQEEQEEPSPKDGDGLKDSGADGGKGTATTADAAGGANGGGEAIGEEEDGGGDDNGSGGTAGTTGIDENAAGGKPGGKKKKKKKKKSKTAKTKWEGEEDASGKRLTLTANKEGGGGVLVEGLPGVLAASDISPVLLEAARAQLCHAVGDPDVDNLIALGYLQVNTGNYRKAVELFRGLLSIRPGLVGAHLGLGSALALLGGMEHAVASFSAAIEADPLEPDCWKRRGQTRAALGHAVGALSDLDRAVELFNGRDPDVLHQRGMVYHKLRYFSRAVSDFSEVVKSSVDSKTDWNMMALCRGQLGEPEAAEEAYRQALAIDPSYKEAWTNLGSLLRDWGKGEKALGAFDNALSLDTAYVHAYYLRGLCKHGMGDHKGAQADFMRGLFYDAQDEHCRYMAALCMHARGQLEEAARCYDALLSLKPGHQAWYTRECCVYLWSNIRRPWREFSPDAELDPEFKEAWCKRHDPMTLRHYTRHRKPTGAQARVTLAEVRITPPAKPPSSPDDKTDPIKTAAANFAKPDVVESVLRAAAPIGPGIQLRCPGFLSNSRQHRMFGLASLELAQLVRRHWDSVKAGGTGAMVPDAGSSRSVAGKLPEGGGGVRGHPVGYRDLFDVAVRWRQLSEPNDPVWWIDRLTTGAFKEGFGLQTPMVNGQLKVVRYYPYYTMALDLMKKLMCEQSSLSEETKAAISHPNAGLAELHEAIGHDHWVVTPCQRSSLGPGSEGRIMEGTRLTIVANNPEGFEFTIRTPGTPERWRQYEHELRAVWGKLTAAFCEGDPPAAHCRGEEGEANNKDDVVCDLILTMFYYWVNFGPLSRGSAACGYIVLSGLMAAAGWRLTEPLPVNVQMDWEAILRPNPEEFIKKAGPWLRRTRRREDVLEGVQPVPDAFPTPLEAIKALNGL